MFGINHKKEVIIFMEKNKVEVYICGEQYTMVSEEEHEHMMNVAGKVDMIMQKLKYKNPMLSVEKAAVLTALNICSDYYKLDTEVAKLKSEDEENSRVQELNKEIEALKAELKAKEDYADGIKNQINERISQSENLKRQVEELKKQLENKTEYAGRIKTELQEKTEQAERLKKHIKDMEEEIANNDNLQKQIIEYADELEKAQRKIGDLKRKMN